MYFIMQVHFKIRYLSLTDFFYISTGVTLYKRFSVYNIAQIFFCVNRSVTDNKRFLSGYLHFVYYNIV